MRTWVPTDEVEGITLAGGTWPAGLDGARTSSNFSHGPLTGSSSVWAGGCGTVAPSHSEWLAVGPDLELASAGSAIQSCRFVRGYR